MLHKMKEVFASLYNDRAISYRVHKGFAHAEVALSAGVQRMVRSDLGAAGVMFTIDTESGFADVVFITSSYGLGETVVQGAVNPDEFYVHKPTLKAGKLPIIRRNLGSKLIRMEFATPEEGRQRPLVRTVDTVPEQRNRYSLADADVVELARYALIIEQHYGRPMDIEWGKDGGRQALHPAGPPRDGEEPGRRQGRAALQAQGHVKNVLAEGRAIGQKIGTGPVRIVQPAEMERVQPGDVLVTDMTDPNWEPVMKRAAAIVTNRGGRTCHAAIIARELGIPAVVGCGDATEQAAGRRPGHRVLLRGRHRLHLRRPARDRGQRRAARRDAVLPDQDHDERRQPAAGLRLRADAQRRRRPGAAGVHHQQQHRGAPEGDPRLPEHRPRPEEGGRVGGPRPCLARAPSTSTSWPKASPPSPRRSGPSR
jgi:phosphoenolpyruvate synthase